MIFREQTAGAIVLEGKSARHLTGRLDYLMRVRLRPGTQPVALALIEAKSEAKHPTAGLEQAKGYARRFNVPFVFASNGHQFVCYDATTGLTTDPALMADFPAPQSLLDRWEVVTGVDLENPRAAALLQPYHGGEGGRRYYQDAAIRAVFEAVARGKNRALLTLATGAGKTYIATQLLKRLFDAGLVRRALFVCDRDELRTQATTALAALFGGEVAAVRSDGQGANEAKNARLHVATYQSLGVDDEKAGELSALTRWYTGNYFDAIVIDECHRSAWGAWSEVLTRNSDAIQIGLTATPRTLDLPDNVAGEAGAEADAKITADNVAYFGEPVYVYDIAQAVEDGYLAVCEIVRRDIFLQTHTSNERETGLNATDLGPLTDARTGRAEVAEEGAHYDARDFEAEIVIPERTRTMCRDLFDHLLKTGGPEQKTIVFCVRDKHADDVAMAMNQLYAQWCSETGRSTGARADPYAFKCTAASDGSALIADFKGSPASFFVATTVDLLSTGVDVPEVRNIVFFKYVTSPISFYQMVGRGTRLTPGKLMFRVYDYTDASRLFGVGFLSTARTTTEPTAESGSDNGTGEGDTGDGSQTLQADGVSVRIVGAGCYVLDRGDDGVDRAISVEEYRARLAERLASVEPSLDGFRKRWIEPDERRAILAALPESNARTLRIVQGLDAYDLFDVLGAAAYGLDPRSRAARAEAFEWKAREWLDGLPTRTRGVLHAVVGQFRTGGTEALESGQIFRVPAVIAAGGLEALKTAGEPRALLWEAKRRVFAA
ncbi:MAG TPA: DEAD/DEAH box helicase family protein [Caulobacteraceae bacterium]|jgi:type I restriction enzyme R subunit|nr:DEAD/DEAH box helicase family protein [Caulobacteraceae bacterium]